MRARKTIESYVVYVFWFLHVRLVSDPWTLATGPWSLERKGVGDGCPIDQITKSLLKLFRFKVGHPGQPIELRCLEVSTAQA